MKSNVLQLFQLLREYKRLKRIQAVRCLDRREHFRLLDLKSTCERLLKRTKADKHPTRSRATLERAHKSSSAARFDEGIAYQTYEMVPVIVGEPLEDDVEPLPVLVGTPLDKAQGDSFECFESLPRARDSFVNTGQISTFVNAFKEDAENADKHSLRDSYDCLTENQGLSPAEALEEQEEAAMPVLAGTPLEAQHPWEGFDAPHGDTHDRLPQPPQPRAPLVDNDQIPAFLDAFKKDTHSANKRSLRDSCECLVENRELFPPEPLDAG